MLTAYPTAEPEIRRHWSLHEDVEYLEWLGRLNAAAQPGDASDAEGSIVELDCSCCREVRTASALWSSPPMCCGLQMSGRLLSGADVWP